MKRLIAALFLLGLTLPAAAGELRAQVLEQLSGIEDPPSAEALSALGDGVTAELVALAQDDSIPRSKRDRAMHALGYFPTDETRSLLVTTLDSPDNYMARKAVYALGNGWGEAAFEELSRALTDADPRLREAAARSMADIDTEVAYEALSAQLAQETVEDVRRAITDALAVPAEPAEE